MPSHRPLCLPPVTPTHMVIFDTISYGSISLSYLLSIFSHMSPPLNSRRPGGGGARRLRAVAGEARCVPQPSWDWEAEARGRGAGADRDREAEVCGRRAVGLRLPGGRPPMRGRPGCDSPHVRMRSGQLVNVFDPCDVRFMNVFL